MPSVLSTPSVITVSTSETLALSLEVTDQIAVRGGRVVVTVPLAGDGLIAIDAVTGKTVNGHPVTAVRDSAHQATFNFERTEFLVPGSYNFGDIDITTGATLIEEWIKLESGLYLNGACTLVPMATQGARLASTP